MYKKGIYKILANEPLTASVWRMVLEGDTEWIVRPGQFVNIALEGRYLRRPISVCDCDARTLTLIYKVVGGGTEQMSRMAAGAELDLLTGLGNGFDTSNDARRPLLVGGGVGVPPLYKLAKALLAEGKPVSVVLGFNTADEVFYADEFRALGCDVHVATADGSAGTKGFVTTAIAGDGIDFESCRNIVMVNSTLDVGDDGICVKSGKDEIGRRRGIPCENIIIDNCTVFHGHGGFVVGSEMSGGVKNVKVSNCRFTGTDVGLRFKSTRGRGGVVENIYIDRIAMADIAQEALLFDLFYGGKSSSEVFADGDQGEPTDMMPKPVDETTPQFRNIAIRDVWCRGARRAMLFNGLPEMNVENVSVENTAVYAETGAQINESTGVTLRNVTVVPRKGPALMINNAKNIVAENFVCPAEMETALTVTGSRNADVVIESKQIDARNAQLSKAAAAAVTIR